MPTILKPSPLETYEFGPLDSNQILEKNKVKEAYANFWNSIQFKKGWSDPPFHPSEVASYLDDASEAVVRIRSALNQNDQKLIDGSSKEYLWSLENTPKHPRRFVKSLVKATFRDAKGYIEGLKGADIEKFLDKYWEYQKTVKQNKKEDIRGNFKTVWSRTCDSFKELLESPLFQNMDAKDLSDDALHTIQSMIKGMNNLQHKAEQLISKSSQMDEEKETSGVSTPNEDDTGSNLSDEKMDTSEETKQVAEETKQVVEETETKMKDEEKDKSSPPQDDSLIKIKVVTEDVASLKTRIQDLAEKAQKLDYSALFAQEGGEKVVEDLQKKCLSYAESLMNDLLKLDSISSSPESRILRKEQVKNIQSMMEEVDSLKAKLHDLLKQLKEEKKKKEMEEQSKQEQLKQEQTKQATQETNLGMYSPSEYKEVEAKAQENESNKRQIYLQTRESRLKEKWKQLKLDPEFQIDEHKDAYIIQGYIPGMKKEDIKLQFSKGSHSLTVEGVRIPTPAEEEQLRTQVRRQWQQDPFLRSKFNQLTPEDEDILVLRASLGRFGRFSETYQLPSSVNVEKIDASYEKGVLKVILPKYQVRPQMRSTFNSPFGHFTPSGHFNDPFVMDQSNWW